jgi:Flp pilus assembly protein TadD
MSTRAGRLIASLALAVACMAQPPANPYQEGIRLLGNREWKAAAAELERAVLVQPKSVDAHIALGIARLRSGDAQSGLQAFRRAVELDAGSAEARLGDRPARERSGGTRPGGCATAVKLSPSREDAVWLSRSGTSKPESWIRHCSVRRGAEAKSKSVKAHNWLGVFRQEKNQFVDAVAEFRKAVQAKPDFVRAWNNLGSALAQSGDVEESVGAFRKAVDLDDADPQLRMNLGIALRAKGDADAALAEFQAVLAPSG